MIGHAISPVKDYSSFPCRQMDDLSFPDAIRYYECVAEVEDETDNR